MFIAMFYGCESEQALGAGGGQRSLACCRLRDCRVGHDWATELNCTDVHYSIAHSSQDMEATWVSVNGWMDKEGVVHVFHIQFTHTTKSFSSKKQWNHAVCSNLDGPGDDLQSEVTQNRQMPYDISYTESNNECKWTYTTDTGPQTWKRN